MGWGDTRELAWQKVLTPLMFWSTPLDAGQPDVPAHKAREVVEHRKGVCICHLHLCCVPTSSTEPRHAQLVLVDY